MDKLEELHYKNGVNDLEYIGSASETTTDVAIKFYKWMRNKDTPMNAEKYFGYSDEDMFNEFIRTNY